MSKEEEGKKRKDRPAYTFDPPSLGVSSCNPGSFVEGLSSNSALISPKSHSTSRFIGLLHLGFFHERSRLGAFPLAHSRKLSLRERFGSGGRGVRWIAGPKIVEGFRQSNSFSS